MQDGAAGNGDGVDESGHLLAAVKFGCSAIFGSKADEAMKLPSITDIVMLTDRDRTDDFSCGILTSGAAEDFDPSARMTDIQTFGGIDFKAIRQAYKKKRPPKDFGHIIDLYREKKRERKSRTTLISGKGSGYGSMSIPVLSANNYCMEEGEKSVLQQELAGQESKFKDSGRKHLKAGVDFENQVECIVCDDAGLLLCCP